MKTYFLIVLFVGLASCDPVENTAPGSKPNLTEGDMALTPAQKEMLFSTDKNKNGVTDTRLRWPGAYVYFWFDNSIRKLCSKTLIAKLKKFFSSSR